MEDTHMDIDSKVCVIIVRGYYTEGERERVQSAMQCSAQRRIKNPLDGPVGPSIFSLNK